MPDSDVTRYVTYCGLYCGLCDVNNRIPMRARQLQQSGIPQDAHWLSLMYSIEEKQAKAFCDVLDKLANLEGTCRTGCGPPDCEIRACVKQKGINMCPKCNDYPCKLVKDSVAQCYPTMIHDGERIREIGLKEWVREQEERRKRGIVYADICVRPVKDVLKELEESKTGK